MQLVISMNSIIESHHGRDVLDESLHFEKLRIKSILTLLTLHKHLNQGIEFPED